MSINLRVALLGADAQEQPEEETSIVMQGPLAEIYRKALNVAYANDDPVSGKPALETQAQDAEYARIIADALFNEVEMHLGPLTVYGVSKNQPSEDDVVKVAAATVEGGPDAERFILVTDATQPGPNGDAGGVEERYELLTNAMESMVLATGGHVVHSLEELKSLVSSGDFRKR